MEKELNYKEIEDYVNDRLEGDAKKAFEARLSDDRALAKEVAFYQDLATTSAFIGDEELRKSIENIDKDLDQKGFFSKTDGNINPGDTQINRTSKNTGTKILSLNLKRIVSLAASLFILTSIAITWWSNSKYSNEALAIGNFDKAAVQMINRSGNGQIDDIFGPGLEALNAENNNEAIRFFGNFPASAEQYAEARLYLGIAYFKNQDFQNALQNAELVAKSSERFREKARWLKINTLLISGQTGSEFEKLLNDMIQNSPDSFYRNEARALKKDLNQFWRKLVL